ncbi:MAG: PilZ domain-containing protein [Thermoanaerobaculia bacterium]
MERRGDRRIARRLEIRFWRRGEAQAHSAFTTNVSASGLYLATGQALQHGERLRLEVVDARRGFVVEARVARVRRVAVALRQVDQAGVGVRFLSPGELLIDLLSGGRPLAGLAADEVPVEALGSESVAVAESTPRSAATASAPPAPQPRVESLVKSQLRIDFPDADSFLQAYYREIVHGGIFLSTEAPAAVGEEVEVEIVVPLPAVTPLRALATVAQRSEPRAAVGAGRNLLAGLALRFRDPRGLLAALDPLRQRLRDIRQRGY